MTAPFRDELAAAHAKIAQLEEEIRKLKGAHYPEPRSAPLPPYVQWDRRRAAIIALCGELFACVLVALIAGVLVLSRAPSAPPIATASPAFSGVAIAPTSRVAGEASSASPKLDKQNPHPVNKPCDCQPGDPLCSCL